MPFKCVSSGQTPFESAGFVFILLFQISLAVHSRNDHSRTWNYVANCHGYFKPCIISVALAREIATQRVALDFFLDMVR